jgi:hypothetical protein
MKKFWQTENRMRPACGTMGLNSIYFQEFKLFAPAFSRGIFKWWIFSGDTMMLVRSL